MEVTKVNAACQHTPWPDQAQFREAKQALCSSGEYALDPHYQSFAVSQL